VAVAIGVAVPTGCASEHDADDESMTPRITESPDAGGLREFLLRESDVHAAGWPDAVAGDLEEDVAAFENPDPRGPCGGVVPQAPLEGSVARSFSTPDTVVIELVVATDDQVESYLARLQADVTPSCGPYESRTNTGATQTYSDIEMVDLEIAGAGSIGWTGTVTVDGRSTSAGVFMVVGEDRTAFTQIESVSGLSPDQVRDLARHAAGRLGA
jgi:hypothetical protein